VSFASTAGRLSAALASSSSREAQLRAAVQAEVLELFDELRGPLLRYALSFGLRVQDGEDVLQEVFLALYRHLLLERPKDNLRGWAFRTTHNLALKRRTHLKSDPAPMPVTQDDVPAEFADETPGPEELLLLRERQSRLQAVLVALPETDRQCLQLRAEGCRYREIAAILGISLGSVAASLARSFRKLERTDAR
jgi:RNA polymerase sigma-70 factor, ECF subfamily